MGDAKRARQCNVSAIVPKRGLAREQAECYPLVWPLDQEGTMSHATVSIETGRSHKGRLGSKRLLDTLVSVGLVVGLAVIVLSLRLPIFRPGLYVGSNIRDFGVASRSDVLRTRFLVRNLHPWSVTVTGTSGNCGCIRTFPGRAVPFTLTPFESAEVDIALDVSTRQGKVEQIARIRTSDDEHGLPLIVRAEVKEEGN
jgi:hypothetical protein